jgi:hypothetical protein
LPQKKRIIIVCTTACQLVAREQHVALHHITLHAPLKTRVGTPFRSQREAHRGRGISSCLPAVEHTTAMRPLLAQAVNTRRIRQDTQDRICTVWHKRPLHCSTLKQRLLCMPLAYLHRVFAAAGTPSRPPQQVCKPSAGRKRPPQQARGVFCCTCRHPNQA